MPARLILDGESPSVEIESDVEEAIEKLGGQSPTAFIGFTRRSRGIMDDEERKLQVRVGAVAYIEQVR